MLPTKVILDKSALQRLVEDYLAFDAFCFDVETVPTRPTRDLERKGELKDDPGLDAMTNRVFWISFAGPGRSDVLPLGHTLPGPPQLDADLAFEILDPLFFSNLTKVNQNVKFDVLSICKYYGLEIPPGPFEDIQGLIHLQDENFYKKGGFNLENLADKLLHYKYKEKLGKRVAKADFWTAARYSAVDSKMGWLLRHKYLPRLQKNPQLAWLYQLESSVLEVLMEMYLVGTYVDRQGFLREFERFSRELEVRRLRVFEKAGKEFNLNSAPQRVKFFYEELGLRCDFFTEKGNKSVDAEALRTLAKKSPVAQALLDYSTMQKLVSQYFYGFIPHIQEDERIRAHYKGFGPVTGRLACTRPNLMNIPVRHQQSFDSKVIRQLFIAPEDLDEEYVLIVADYGQIELRVLAHQCRDPKLIMAYTEEIDLHVLTASMIYNIPIEKVSKDQRAIGKTSNFNLAFEGGPKRIKEAVEQDGGKISLDECKWVYRRWHDSYPRVRKWGDYQKQLARERGYVETLFGRRRRLLPDIRLPETTEANSAKRSYAERQAVNHPIQGSAADIAKIALVRIQEAWRDTPANLVMQVHDEFIGQVPRRFADEAVELMRPAMTDIKRDGKPVLRVPLVVDIHYAKSWAEAK